jgi:hypothetical protein
MIELTGENYHSKKANSQYMSVSTFKSFLPWYSYGCEAKAVAKINGEWEEEESSAMLLGSYIHAWAEGRLQKFRANHPQLFKKNGGLYAKYKHADKMIETIKNDEYMMKVLQGGKEEIITGELFGVPWKAKIDVINDVKESFTDLKTTREIGRDYYNEHAQEYQNFINYWGYDIQMAVYAELIKQQRKLDSYYMPHIAVVDKQDPPDKVVIYFGTDWIQEKLEELEIAAERVVDVWAGKKEPHRCGKCDYCRSTKKITESIYWKDF